jgi:hypothetical protein
VNAGNDTRDVAIEINNASVAANDTGGGKGGGGRLEWLALAFLLSLLKRKWGHSSFAAKRDRAQ